MAYESPTIELNDGTSIPQLGYGVWQVADDTTEKVVGLALEAGYRHIDTARIYGNEEGVGRAIAASGLAPEDLYVTTKVWNSDQGRDKTLAAFDASMDRLGLETLDLYLIHWLQPKRGLHVETWKALTELRDSGRVRSIGVCNFTVGALQELEEATGVVPSVLQIETHPYLQQRELFEYCQQKGIAHESWSPLGNRSDLLGQDALAAIADKHGVTPAQVVIAWHLQRGSVVIPKSETPSRIVENWEALGVRLDGDDVEAIDAMDRGAEGRIGPDPAVSDFE